MDNLLTKIRDWLNEADQKTVSRLTSTKKPVQIDTSGGLFNRVQSAIFTPLAKVQSTIEDPNFSVPKFSFANNKTGVAGFGLNVAQDLLNTPSNYGEGIINTGVGIGTGKRTRTLKGVGQIGGSLLNVASFGTGSSLVKEAGETGLKQLIKEGAITGGKYGAGYGLTGGLVEHSDSQSIAEQLLKTVPDVAIGGLAGTVIGGSVAGGVGVLGKLKGSLTKEVEAEISKVSSSKLAPAEKTKVLTSLLNETEAETKLRRAKGITPQQAYGGQQTTLDFKGAFEDWVNGRRAAPLEGLISAKKFESLDNEGIEGIFKFQSGERKGLYGEVQKFFDNKYQELQKAGIKFNYKDQYLPQLWVNPEDEVRAALGRSLTQRPKFSLESIIKDYKAGIDIGLTPRFTKISDLVRSYEATANKALVDRNFFDTLIQGGYIVPADKAPYSWKTLSPDKFPSISIKIPGQGKYTGNYKAPAELGNLINNYLDNPHMPILKATADFSTAIKNLGLNAGIPNVKPLENSIGGLNFHTFNIQARHILFSKNLSELFTGVKYVFNRNAARKYVDEVLPELPKMVKAGLTVSTEDKNAFYGALKEVGPLTKAGEKLDQYFSKPLFEEIVPALKAQHFKSIEADLLKSGMNPKEAEKLAAKQVNNIFGGINWEQLGRSKDTQNLLRSVLLAPDWAETTLNIGKGTVKSLLNPRSPESKVYLTGIRNLLIAYASLNVLNYMSSGHLAFQNDPGHSFEIESGYTNNGQKRYIRPFGTGVDYVRLPYDIVSSAIAGDSGKVFSTVRNRLSPVASQAVGQLTNTNYFGGKIANPEDPIEKQLLARGGDALSNATPSFIGSPIQYATGQVGAEQALTRSLELPTTYTGGPYTKTQKTATQSLTGKEKYDISKELKGESLSENQQQQLQSLIDSGYSGKDALDVVLFDRRMERAQKAILSGEKATLPTMPDSQIEDQLLKDVAEQKALRGEEASIKFAFENGKSQTQVEALLKQLGVTKSYDESKYQIIKSLPTEEQAGYVWFELLKAPSSGTGYLKQIKKLTDAGVLTSAIVSQWEEDGKIDEDKKRAINNAIKIVSNKKITGSKKPKKVGIPSLPKVKTVKVSMSSKAPTFKPLKRISYKKLRQSVTT